MIWRGQFRGPKIILLSSSFKPMVILGGAFGLGLRRNVIALYKFVCRNYRNADDKLFGFGFSRGAFLILTTT